jgi:hypothetical protein
MGLQIDPGPLQQYALRYQMTTTIFDAFLVSFLIGFVSLIRYFLKKRKRPNLNPSKLWYVPKVIGMGLLVVNFMHFVVQGALVNRLAEGNLGFFILATLIGLGLLYWGYRVIWKPLVPKAA